jgi:hypothetical protein
MIVNNKYITNKEIVMTKHKHHIIPKHMGGSNDESNLIELTVAEHAEAHRALFEQHGCWQDEVAYKALSGQINSDQARREATRRTWLGRKHTPETKQKIKDAVAGVIRGPHTNETKEKISQALTGHAVSDETKELWSKQRTGRLVTDNTRQKISKANKGKTLTEEHKQKLKVSKSAEHKQKISKANKGKILTEEHKQKISEARLGMPVLDETKQKISESLKGRKRNYNVITPESNVKRSKSMKGRAKPITQCPHCKKQGGEPQMKQWHFDNCKEKTA